MLRPSLSAQQSASMGRQRGPGRFFGNEPGLAPCFAMQKYAAGGSLEGRHSLCQQAADDGSASTSPTVASQAGRSPAMAARPSGCATVLCSAPSSTSVAPARAAPHGVHVQASSPLRHRQKAAQIPPRAGVSTTGPPEAWRRRNNSSCTPCKARQRVGVEHDGAPGHAQVAARAGFAPSSAPPRRRHIPARRARHSCAGRREYQPSSTALSQGAMIVVRCAALTCSGCACAIAAKHAGPPPPAARRAVSRAAP